MVSACFEATEVMTKRLEDRSLLGRTSAPVLTVEGLGEEARGGRAG